MPLTEQEEFELLSLEREKAMAGNQPEGDSSSFWKGLGTIIPDPESLKIIVKAGLFGDAEAGAQIAKALFNAHKDQFMKSMSDIRQGENISGLGHMGAALLPVLGPAAAHAGEMIGSGKINEGLGEGVAQIIPFLPGAGLSDISKATGLTEKLGQAGDAVKTRLYQSALKPSTKLSPAERLEVTNTAISKAIPVSRGGLDKARQIIEDLGNQVDAKINDLQATNPEGFKIDPQAVAQRAEDIKPNFNTVTKSRDQGAIEAVKQQFLEDHPEAIPGVEAQQIKQNTYRSLKDRAYGEQKGPGVEAEKALARGIKEELENFIPDLKYLNADQGATIGLEKQLRSAVARIKNWQMIGLGTPAAAGAGYTVGGKAGAVALGTLKALLDQPQIKSYLAFAIDRAQTLKAANVAKGALAGTISQEIKPQP